MREVKIHISEDNWKTREAVWIPKSLSDRFDMFASGGNTPMKTMIMKRDTKGRRWVELRYRVAAHAPGALPLLRKFDRAFTDYDASTFYILPQPEAFILQRLSLFAAWLGRMSAKLFDTVKDAEKAIIDSAEIDE